TNKINKYSTTKNIDDITDQIITNISKSKPEERVIAFSNNKNYQNTERKINIVEAISSKKQNQNDNLIEKPDLQAELSGYNSSFSAYSKVNIEQAQIQQNYQDFFNNKKQKLDDDFNYTEDVELDVGEEEPYEQFARENRNNSLYQGL
ncbi:12787_t:CDS:2, partial [Dentiscutata heterogama]